MLAFLAVLRHALSTLVPVGQSGSTKRDGVFRVHHPCGLIIQQGLEESDVGAIPKVKSRDMGNGYHWYALPKADISGQLVGISLCFFKGVLQFVMVGVIDGDEGEDPWKNWSAEREKARVEAARLWFVSVGCEVGDYPWGTVFAEIDYKTGDASGGVRFNS
jgi:hypothetical protein